MRTACRKDVDVNLMLNNALKSLFESIPNDSAELRLVDSDKTLDIEAKDKISEFLMEVFPENSEVGDSDPYSFNIISALLERIFLLSQEVKELREIIEHSPNSIVVADGEGKILQANKAFESLNGVKPTQIIGRNANEVEKDGIFTPCINDLIRKEKRRLTLIQRTKVSTVVSTGVPIFDKAGNIYRVIFNAQDLRELKQMTEFLDVYGEMAKSPAEDSGAVSGAIVRSEVMKDIFNDAMAVAKATSTVLITGESGVGKEVIAKYIHQHSNRNQQKFVQINCGAIPDTLLESELFGYESGAFTGATKGGKVGLIETANKGTLFLDEIAELPLNMQTKLLTVIQNKQMIKVGGNKPISIDVRYIAATNRNLDQMVENGLFRRDLFYRLNVIPIHIPALRNRRDDIIPLVENVLSKINRQFQKNISFSKSAMDFLLSYDWPGNIRELENIIERIVVTARKSIMSKNDLPIFTAKQFRHDVPVVVTEITTLERAFEEVEKQLILIANKNCDSSYKVAKELGISQSAAYRKMQKYLKSKEEE